MSILHNLLLIVEKQRYAIHFDVTVTLISISQQEAVSILTLEN